ncbi:MAG: GxxExxY protein [Flavobacteriales bacterium]|nr:GxxExxY protein [Flavobacteriales bacterium]
MEPLLHGITTGKILEAFFNVYHELGYGFLEKVYENAMLIELEEMGLACQAQQPISVFYHDENVGEYFADIVVENKVIIELKAVETISEQHEAQLINYLRATNMEVGLLLNFGKKPQHKRKVFSNHRK